MEHYLILARSITAAQRIRDTLEKAGIRASLQRAPTGLSPKGCSYAVRIGTARWQEAAALTRQLGLVPFSIFAAVNGTYREVK